MVFTQRASRPPGFAKTTTGADHPALRAEQDTAATSFREISGPGVVYNEHAFTNKVDMVRSWEIKAILSKNAEKNSTH
jgi:hypothetical protein